MAACLFALAGGAAAASAASALPTLNLALTGKTGISVSGSEVSGAVNVVSTFTGKGQGQAALVRLNPALPPAQALAQGFQAVQSHHGDLNALTALGDALVFDAGAPGTAQTVLTPGAWVALNVTGSGNPAVHAVHGQPVLVPGRAADARRHGRRDRVRVPWREHAAPAASWCGSRMTGIWCTWSWGSV